MPWIIGDLVGQLGNQLFVIAATFSLALDHGAIPIFPDLVVKDSLDLPVNYEKLFYFLPYSIPREDKEIRFSYQEPHFHYAPIPYEPNMRLSGFFQSEKYFAHHKREILELFAPSKAITEYLQNTYGFILEHPNTVALHLRYYHEDPQGRYYHRLDRSYIENAIHFFPKDALFIVFSNEMGLCKELLKEFRRNFIFIENETHYHDFYLMSLCKHNIISNSTFSWWAAYLNRNPQKIVIAPKKWFVVSHLDTKDLLPSEWIQL
jgi:hypothetical protein